jgi:excisionase family DNA binding protein
MIQSKQIESNEVLITQKQVLTFKEACKYSGLSKSKMYKHTSTLNIPFYKPEGKFIYFKRSELEAWLLRNRHSSKTELEIEANKYLNNSIS